LKDFNIENYRKGEVLVHMFLELTVLDWKSNVNKMNSAVEASKAKCKWSSCEEFLIGLGLKVGVAELPQKGVDLFGGEKGDEEDDNDMELWPYISPNLKFEQLWLLTTSKTSEDSCLP
jgi:hypothetical protein